ncbi:ATP:cob(I)alamin adenosyltransferase [Formosimonas limnophila]|uniref:Cobalamin adenosyltransferase n=1 Tax=Formosimonas limnophila TaxID=1384487 RepID=A0A8J3G0J3_9BURK|nr:cob(I)yrinic acid a,c-diamide adenosyltransferase [Formosimonas limnophila]GHA74698.1 ATP:cob(I)alamin adenosyltransferase [Formosimonas limnophila]
MNRLDDITTRTGDDGTTALADGSRHPKSAPRFVAMGDVDELNAHIGLLRSRLRVHASDDDKAIDEFLIVVQHHLFEVGSELAVPGMTFLAAGALDTLDGWGQRYNAQLSALKEFILPSGTLAASQAHVCRTVARRAERSLVALNQLEPINATAIQFLNRCSDVFFIMARVLNQNAQHPETYWRGNQ